MWRTNNKIGFDDRLLILLMTPVSSFIVPFVFFGLRFQRPPYLTWKVYLTTLIITVAIWVGNRYVMIWARTRYPEFSDVKKRLTVQAAIMLGYTLIATNVLGAILHDYCGLQTPQYAGLTMQDIVINSNNASIFSSLAVVAIYESIYFMNELRKSIEEKELLKRESLQAQLNALKTQVNPHFLFNNLNTLTAVIPDNPQQAIAFVQQLSKVYRHILEVKDEKLIPLQEELDVLKAYAFLLKTRFGSNLAINIDVAGEKMQKQIVPLSLQLLMENAIKHNIVSSDRPLQIDVYAVNGTLIVRNNLQKKNQLFESTGIGLDNIRNRYKLLGEKLVEVKESSDSFTVSIPLIEN
jgi:two-component system, LytTR family, sensor kinase